jgi:peptidoglycan/LPS O-acetylase OafA/YrhL
MSAPATLIAAARPLDARAVVMPAASEPARIRMGGLDALRMFAAGLVFVSHLALYGGLELGLLQPFAVHGRIGVVIFFVLSGYLLIRPFLYAPVSLRRYALRRMARILPAYYLALLGSSLLLASTQVFAHPLEYLTLTQNYDPAVTGQLVSVSWTLTIEVAFYALVPLLAAGLLALPPLRAVEAVLVGIVVSLVASFLVSGVYQGPTLVALLLPFFLWAFGLGILLALVERHWERRLRGLERYGLWLGVPLLVTALYLGAWAPVDVPTALAAVCLVAALRHRKVAYWAALLGDRCSYGFYVWHEQIVRALATFTMGWPLAFLAGPAAVAVAFVSYRLVERPAQRWRRASSDRQAVRASSPDRVRRDSTSPYWRVFGARATVIARRSAPGGAGSGD